MLVSLFFNCYIGNFEPYNSKRKNTLELYNEATIFYATMSLYLFTDFVPIAETQNEAGWLIISVVLLNMLINWSIFLWQTIGKLCWKIKLKILRR